jgi:gas vesicle protein
MKKLTELVKSWQLKRLFVIFLAGSLLIISTACSQGTVASAGSQVKRQLSDTYDKYNANQPAEGGMNVYNDDTLYDNNPGLKAKTKALVDQAKVNTNSEHNVGEEIKQLPDKAGKNINQARKDITNDIKEKTRTLQDNIGEATDNLGQAAENTAENLKNKVKDLT